MLLFMMLIISKHEQYLQYTNYITTTAKKGLVMNVQHVNNVYIVDGNANASNTNNIDKVSNMKFNNINNTQKSQAILLMSRVVRMLTTLMILAISKE